MEHTDATLATYLGRMVELTWSARPKRRDSGAPTRRAVPSVAREIPTADDGTLAVEVGNGFAYPVMSGGHIRAVTLDDVGRGDGVAAPPASGKSKRNAASRLTLRWDLAAGSHRTTITATTPGKDTAGAHRGTSRATPRPDGRGICARDLRGCWRGAPRMERGVGVAVEISTLDEGTPMIAVEWGMAFPVLPHGPVREIPIEELLPKPLSDAEEEAEVDRLKQQLVRADPAPLDRDRAR